MKTNTEIPARIDDAIGILQFDDRTGIDRIREAFFAHSRSLLGQLLERVPASESRATVAAAPPSDLLLVPEVLHRLYRRKSLDPVVKVAFMERTLDAVRARREGQFDREKYPELWTSDGSFLIQWSADDGDFTGFEAPTLLDGIVLDFFSLYNRLIPNSAYNMPAEYSLELYDFAVADTLVNRFERLANRMSPVVQRFLADFIAVIAFRRLPAHPEHFSSGTDGGYIGRVLICNAEEVEDEIVVDALVHEAIHGLLFQIDELHPWMPDVAASNATGRVIHSPWTGNALTIRNLLQASFVWYGLFNFWSRHRTTFDPGYVPERLAFIQQGFKGLDLQAFDAVPGETRAAVQSIRQHVLATQL